MEELKTQLSEIEDVIASYEAQIEIYHTYKFEVLKKMYPSYKDYIERLMNVSDDYIFLEVYVEDFGIKTFLWDEKYDKKVVTFHNCIINGGVRIMDVNDLIAKWERVEKEREEFNKQFISTETIVKVVVSKDLEATLDLLMSDVQKFNIYHINPYEPDKYIVPEDTFEHIVSYLNSVSKPVQIENDGYFTVSLFCIKYKGTIYEYEAICGQGTEDWIKVSDRKADNYIELVVE